MVSLSPCHLSCYSVILSLSFFQEIPAADTTIFQSFLRRGVTEEHHNCYTGCLHENMSFSGKNQRVINSVCVAMYSDQLISIPNITFKLTELTERGPKKFKPKEFFWSKI